MKQWKKYLVAAGTVSLILILAVIINNNRNKEGTVIDQYSTSEVKENIQAGNEISADKETNSILEAEENTSESDIAEENTSESDTVDEKSTELSEDEIKSEINKVVNSYYGISVKEDKDGGADKEQTAENQTENNQTENNQIADKQTANATVKKNAVIEKYKNVKIYIKPGLKEDTYVVFSTYSIKLYNIDTLVPGMSSMYVIRDENGNFLIDSDSNNKELNDYISSLAKENNIKKIIKEVNSKLKEAVNKDTSLKEFIDYLK